MGVVVSVQCQQLMLSTQCNNCTTQANYHLVFRLAHHAPKLVKVNILLYSYQMNAVSSGSSQVSAVSQPKVLHDSLQHTYQNSQSSHKHSNNNTGWKHQVPQQRPKRHDEQVWSILSAFTCLFSTFAAA